MKKFFKLFLTVIIILLACSCTKKASSSEDISKVLNENGYIIKDETNLIEDNNIEKLYIVTNNKYQFEYHVYKEKSVAKEKYESNKIELKENSNKNITEKNKEDYDKLIQEHSDKYTVIVRNKKILLYSSINSEYKKEFKKILKKLGY